MPDDRYVRNIGTCSPDSKVILDIEQIIIDGEIRGINVHHEQYPHNGIILSLCNICDLEIAKGLGKEACVEIIDTEKLKLEIDKQLGIKGEARNCKYTQFDERSPFLKSEKDRWQKEFRIFWLMEKPKTVYVAIPKGTAKLINFF